MNRVFIGKSSDTFVFRVSKPGKPVESINDDDFLLNESTYNAAPILTGVVSSVPFSYRIADRPTGDGGRVYDNAYKLVIPHFLGYIPMLLTSQVINGSIYVDNSYITITAVSTKFNDSSTGPLTLQYPISYYIFSVRL
jgi:hypothetical protein